jgi:hypothetical protein
MRAKGGAVPGGAGDGLRRDCFPPSPPMLGGIEEIAEYYSDGDDLSDGA